MNTLVKDPKVKGALDDVRKAAQELHKSLSDAAARRGGAVKADIEAVPQMAQAAITSLKGSIGVQNATAKKQVAEAITHLEATQKHAAEGLKSSGHKFRTSVKQILTNAHASVQKVSEAVAAARSAHPALAAAVGAGVSALLIGDVVARHSNEPKKAQR